MASAVRLALCGVFTLIHYVTGSGLFRPPHGQLVRRDVPSALAAQSSGEHAKEAEAAVRIATKPLLHPQDDEAAAKPVGASLMMRGSADVSAKRSDPKLKDDKKQFSGNSLSTDDSAEEEDETESSVSVEKAAVSQSCFEGFQPFSGKLGGKPRCPDPNSMVSMTASCSAATCSESVDLPTCCITFEMGWAEESFEVCTGSWEKDLNFATGHTPFEECKEKCETLKECTGIVVGNKDGQADTCVVCTGPEWNARDTHTEWATSFRFNRGSTFNSKKLCEDMDDHTRTNIKLNNKPTDPCAVTEDKANYTFRELEKNPPPEGLDELHLNATLTDFWPQGNVEEGDPDGKAETAVEYTEAEASAPRRRRRHPPVEANDVRLSATPAPTRQLTVYYEDNAMWAEGKMTVGTELCQGMNGFFRSGNEECQFHTAEHAKLYCDVEVQCKVVIQLARTGECAGEFGCFVPRTGNVRPAKYGQRTWVKQTQGS